MTADSEYTNALRFLCDLDSEAVSCSEEVDALWRARPLPLVLVDDFHAGWSCLRDRNGIFVDKIGVRFSVQPRQKPRASHVASGQGDAADQPLQVTYVMTIVAKITWQAFSSKSGPASRQGKHALGMRARRAFSEAYLSKIPSVWSDAILAHDLHLAQNSRLLHGVGPAAQLKFYDRLADPTNIRLLTILPALENHAPLRCRLGEVRLDSCPEFQALSYVWGSTENPRTILLGETKVEVTSNLYFALRALRAKTADRVMWVDAVCINQSDNDEKQTQVAQMDMIYKQATEVVVWLGPESTGSWVLFKCLEDIQKSCGSFMPQLLPETATWEELELPLHVGIHLTQTPYNHMGDDCPQCRATLWHEGQERGTESERSAMDKVAKWHNECTDAAKLTHGKFQMRAEQLDCAEACLKLLKRPYWKRMWVLQEVILAKKLVVQCGTQSADWFWFQRLAFVQLKLVKKAFWSAGPGSGRAFTLATELRQILSQIYPFVFLRNDPAGLGDSAHRSLAVALSATANAEATVPLDKIYGLLGLLPQTSAFKLQFKPDYNQSPKKLFVALTRFLIDNMQCLDVLTARPARANYAKLETASDLPSWVPDWMTAPDRTSNVISQGLFSNFSTRNLFRGRRRTSGDVTKGGNDSTNSLYQAGLSPDLRLPYKFTSAGEVLSVHGLVVGTVASVLPFHRGSAKADARLPNRQPDWSLTADPEQLVGFTKSFLMETLHIRWDACVDRLGGVYEHTGQSLSEAFWRTILLDRICGTSSGTDALKRMPELDETRDASKIWPFPARSSDFRFPPETLAERAEMLNHIVSQNSENLEAFDTDMYGQSLTFFITKNGYIGLGHPGTADGDTVVVLTGGSVPYTLRKVGSLGHVLVGECYVHGVMDGELVKGNDLESGGRGREETFTEFHII